MTAALVEPSTSLRLLFIPQCPLSWELGGSKVQLALAEQLKLLGWDIECIYPFDSCNAEQRALLAQFDVVDWESSHCIRRAWLPSTNLSICRFPLLTLHLADGLPWPQPLRQRLDWLLDPLRRLSGRTPLSGFYQQALHSAVQALPQADAIGIQNKQDRECLLRHGISSERILLEPCGLRSDEAGALQATIGPSDQTPVLAFLGSFDYRKGCKDLVWLCRQLARSFPMLQFRLIGTNGLFQGEAPVRRFFPSWLQSRLRVIPRFSTETLPEQLSGVSIGVFPSYLDSFGIAVIEQLAAGIPVIAYDALGPADILPQEWLAPRGSRQRLLQLLAYYLSNPQALQSAKKTAYKLSLPYRWSLIARRWDHHYRRLLDARRA